MGQCLKILVLNYEFPPLGGGASPVSYEISKRYAKLGNKVDVVTMGFNGLPEFEKKEGINIYRVKCWRSKKEICHPWEQLTYILSAKKFLESHLKENTYDINHSHFIIPTGIVSLWLKKNYGLEYIVTSHGSDVLGYNNKRSFKYIYPLVSKAWEEIVKEAKFVVSPSKFLKGEIEKLSKGNNLVVIPNGIDAKKFKPMSKEKRILIVARLFENKGVQDVLDSIKELDIEERGWGLDIVGDGPYREFLEKKAEENNLKNVVKFHGWLDNGSQELKEIYGKASIFISASWFESFGLTVLEALQAECYVLVSDNMGHKQLDLGEDHYFGVNALGDLKKKLNLLLNSKSLKVKNFDDKFEWQNVIKKYESMLI